MNATPLTPTSPAHSQGRHFEIHYASDIATWIPPPGPIVLLVSYSRFGYGHVSRCVKLAQALRAHTDLEPVVVSGSPGFFAGLADLDFDVLSLPAFLMPAKNSGGKRAGVGLASPLPDVPAENLASHRGHLMAELARRAHPAAVVLDHFPFSGRKSLDECGELVDLLAAQGPPIPVLGGYRGLLSQRFLEQDGSTDRIASLVERYIHRLHIYLDPGQAPGFYRDHPFLEPFRDRIELVGYIAPQPAPPQRSEPGLCLATFGSGCAVPTLVESVCEAFRLLGKRRPDLRPEVVVGALFRQSVFERLEAKYRPEGICLQRHVPGLWRRFSAAELVVCTAGYNTLVELHVLGRGKVVAMPQTTAGRGEQMRNAQRFRRLGTVDAILDGSQLSPDALADLLEEVASTPSRARQILDLAGAERVAERLRELCRNSSRSLG